MLTALLTDIHGNREALDACLDDARRRGLERFLFLGDYVGYGADPSYVLDTVARHAEEGAVALLGNHDEAVFAPSPRMNPFAAAAIAWTRERLDAAQLAFLRARPLSSEEGERLFVHANAADPRGWGYVTTAAEAACSMNATRRRVTFCGHVHVPALFRLEPDGRVAQATPAAEAPVALAGEGRVLAVLGAVGQPRDGDPRACYGLLDEDQDTLTYVRVPYDIERAAAKIVQAGLPPALAARLYRGL